MKRWIFGLSFVLLAAFGTALALGNNRPVDVPGLPAVLVELNDDALGVIVGKDLLCDVAGISRDEGFVPSLGGTGYASGGGSRTSIGRAWRSLNESPGDWKLEAAHVEKGNYGAVSVQERWVHRATGERIWVHKATDARGGYVKGHPHPRNYFYDQDGGYSGIPRSRW